MSNAAWKNSELDAALTERLAPGPERGGVILDDGSVVEFINLADDPENLAVFDVGQLIPYEHRVVASWHTHPDASATLTTEDWETFRGWPAWLHAIVGTDGVRWYAVKGRAVVNA
jgi:hypothetical protein